MYYDPKIVMKAWKLLINASKEFSNSETFKNDLLEVTRHVLGDISYFIHRDIVESFNISKNITQFRKLSEQFLILIDDLETLLLTSKYYLVGTWINDAKRWGSNIKEQQLFELNAKTIITLWGPSDGELYDYASKLWQGLMGDFYKRRWQIFFDILQYCLNAGVPFSQEAFEKEVQKFEENWTLDTKQYPTEPQGNTFNVVQTLFEKYKDYEEK